MKTNNYSKTQSTSFNRWMLFAGIAMMSMFTFVAQAQVSVTATAGDVGPTAYTTVNAAFTAINAGTHQGDITVTVTANTTEPATPVPLLRSNSPSSYTSVLITASGDVTINSAASPSTNRGIIELAGADNVTIDGDDPGTGGDRNLTIQSVASSTAGIACVRISSNSATGTDGADNVTVKNCNIVGSRNSATSTVNNYGIQFSNGTSTSSSSTGAYSSLNTVIENNLITRTYRAVHAYGSSSSYPNTGIQILNNIMGSSTSADNIGFRGILIQYSAVSSGGAVISGNDISVGDLGSSGYSSTIAGIEVGTVNYGISIIGNNIHDINQPSTSGYGAHGIYVTGSTNNTLSTIANNFIRDCKMVVYQTSTTSTFIPTGVFFTAGATGVSFIHNTISLGAQLGSGVNFSSFGVNASVSGVRFTEFSNNIVVNNSTSTTAYGFYTSNTLNISGGTVNNNNYYVPGGHVGYYNAGNRTSLADWQSATSKDAASLNINPPFTSSSDLHIPASTSTLLESGGLSSSITTDFDGDSRPSGGLAVAPDIGADEFDGSNPNFCSGTPTAGTISGAASVCGGTGTTLSLSGASTESGISYQWASSTTMGGPYTNMGTAATQATGALTVDTYYIVTLTCSNGGGTASAAEHAITITAAPSVGVSGSASAYCTGGSPVTLTASGADTYAWSPAGGLSATTGTTVDATPTLNTTYTVVGTDAGTTCTASATTTVAVVGTPTVSATATPAFVCSGGNSQLFATGVSGTQVANYGYTYSTGATLDPMSGSTTVISSGNDDTPMASPENIGFSFVLNGTAYTQYSASPDGWLRLGSGTATAEYSNSVTSTSNTPKIYGYWDDLATGTDGNVQTLLTGTAPSRIFIAQWFVTIPRNTTGAANSTFQVWLYEGSNKIELRYGTMGSGSMSASVGVTASATSYQSITVTSNTSSNTTANNSVANQPASGTMYSFSPGAFTYSWTPSTFLNFDNIQDPEAQSVTATTTYTVVASELGCVSSGSDVTVSLATPVSVAVNSPTICDGQSAALTAVPTDGGPPITYAWSPATDLDATTGVTVNASPTSTIDYTVTATDACATTASAIATVTVEATPSASVTPAGPLVECLNEASQLVSSTSAGSPTYQWTLNGGNIGVGGTSANYTPAASGNYAVIVTDGNCSSTSNVVAVTINPSPTAVTADADVSAICAGGVVNLTSSANSGESVSLNYSEGFEAGLPSGWTVLQGGTGNLWTITTSPSGSAHGGSGVAQYLYNSTEDANTWLITDAFNLVAGATYTIEFWERTSGSFPEQLKLTVGTAQTIAAQTTTLLDLGSHTASSYTLRSTTFAPSSTGTYYFGWHAYSLADEYYINIDDISITGSLSIPASFAWTSTPGGFTSAAMDTLDHPSSTLTYTVTATNSFGCTASATTSSVYVNDLGVSGTPTDATCYGVSDGSIVASGSGGTPAYEYSLDGSIWQSSATFSGLASGTYTLYIKDTQPCTTSVGGIVVGSPAQLVVSASTGYSGFACDGDDVTLTATSGFVSYDWTGPNSYSDNVNPSVITGAGLVANGTYTVTVSDGSCSETATTDVTLNPVGTITVSLASGANPSCDGTPITFTATPANAPSPTYEFFLNTVSVQNSSSDTYTYTPVDGDQLYVVLSQVTSGCATGSPATSNTVTQNVDTVPDAPTISAGGPLTFCANIADVTLTSSYVGGNEWSTTETTDAITTNVSGSYTVTYTDGNGCSATSAATVVTANTSAVAITSSNPGGLCTGATVTLTANATPAATDYLWSTTETTQAIDITTSGTYDVTTTDANGCTATNSIVVSDVALPTASISGNASICTGTTETLTASATAGSGTIATYQWVLNGSTNVGLNQDTYDATAAGSYTVIVTNSNGCSVTSAAHVLAATGPLSGAYTIGAGAASCTNYTSFASAFNDLNTKGVAGNVVFTVSSGYTETAPAGGLTLNQCALSTGLVSNASQTISFVSAGAPNPVITAGVGTSTTLDAIVKLVGADYVTFNGIDLAESAANTTSTTRAEWGYALLKCDGNNGSNYNNIINCSVTLNKAHTATRAIYSGNHTAASTTGLSYTGLANDPAEVNASRNGNNTFYGNSIQNTYGAFSLNGNSSASGNQSLNDTLNAIGVIGQGANVITDFGGTSTSCTVIGSANQRGITIDNNSITGGTGTTSTLTGINPGAGVWGKIRNNQLNLVTSSTSSSITGISISFGGGSVANPNIVMVTGNTVTMSSTTLTSGTITGITCSASGTGAQITVRSNTVSGCTFNSATSGAFNGITQTHSSSSTVNDVSNNIVSSNSVTGTGQFLGVNSFAGNSPTSSTLSMDTNTVSLNTKGGTGSMFCIYNGVTSSASLTMTQNGNTVNGNVITGGSSACTLVGITAQATNYTMDGNTVTNNSVTTVSGTAAGNVLAIQSSGAGTATSAITNNTIAGVTLGGVSSGASLVRGILATTAATDNRTISGNNISDVSTSFTTSATCIGIISVTGGTSNIYKNKIYGFTPGQNGTVFSGTKGIIIGGGTTNNVYNNLIGFDFSVAVLTSNNSVVGLEVSGGTNTNLSYNTVRLAGSGSGTSFGSSGINLTVTTANVTMKNNLILNLLNSGGTGGAAAVGLRRTSAALTGYNSASNNNLWYAGAASSSHLLYYDGTNSDQTIAAFKARVSPAESASQSGNPTLLSVSGASANFLHVDPSVSNLAESGGMAITGIDDDFDGDIRQGSIGYAGTGTAPDIGADEFDGISSAPTFSNVVNPTVSCTASSHAISIDVATAAGVIDSVKLSYSFNAVPQTPINMTVPTSGNTYSFTVPVATPGNAVVTWSVAAYNSGGFSSIYTGTSYQDEYLVAPLAVASPDTICLGESVDLLASGPPPAAPAASSYCASTHTSGCSTDAITNVTLNTLVNTTGCNVYTNYSGLGGAYTTTISAGSNPHSLSISFGSDGSQYSGAWIDYNHDGVYDASEFLGAGGNAGSNGTIAIPFNIPLTAYNGVTRMRVIGGNDSPVTSGQACGASSSTWGETEDYDVTITGATSFGPADPIFTSFSWSDGVNTVTGNPAVAIPSAAGTYTFTLTASDGVCSINASTDTVVVLPIPAAPFGVDSTQCGNGIPACYVQGTVGATFNWYDAASGGTLLQSGLDTTYLTSINATTVFYVSEVGTNGCPGERVMVTATVTAPDPIDAQSTLVAICPNESIDLSVIQTGSNNTYDYTWTASPSSGSGISGTLIGSPVNVTPFIPGTYTYIVTAIDIAASCVIQDSVSVLVNNVPNITSITAIPDTICAGDSTVLTALTPGIGPGTVLSGTATTTEFNGVYRNGFGNGDFRHQLLFTAAELSSAGLYAGDITGLTFHVSSAGSGSADNYNIRMAHTSATALSSSVLSASLVNVANAVTYTAVLGDNYHPFNIAPFTWDGTSNVLIDICYTISAFGGSSTLHATTPAFIGNVNILGTAGACTSTGTTNTFANRPIVTFSGQTNAQSAGTYNWVWDPGTLSGNQVSAFPGTSTNYTVTATDPATTCTNSANINVFVNPSPPAPTAVNGSHCGNLTPTCSVIGNGGAYFTWYTDSTSNSFIAGQSGSSLVSYPRTQTDTFYVSETYAVGSCEGPRVMVIETYTAADAITATATVPNDTICPFGTVTLDATQGTLNTYTTYDWTTVPAGGSATGQNTTASAPNIPGQLIWKVTASDGTCSTEAYDTIFVAAPPAIASLTASEDSVCPGTNVTLTAQTAMVTTYYTDSVTISLSNPTTDEGNGSSGTGGYVCPGNNLIGSFTLPVIAGTPVGASLKINGIGLNGGSFGSEVRLSLSGSGITGTSPCFQGASSTSTPNPFNYVTGVGGPASDTATMAALLNPAGGSVSINYADAYNDVTAGPDASFPASATLVYTYSVTSPATAVTWTWEPGTIVGNPIVVNPTSTTTYTVKAEDGNAYGCYNEATITVVVNPEPLAPINPVDLVQCGSSVPLISVTRSGASTDSFKWYTVSSGGTAIVGETDSVLTSLIVSATTTFYVAEFNGYCEGPRTAVTVTVNQPDLVTINASATSVCLPVSPAITLDAVQTGSTSNYVYTWSANPSGTAGLSGTSGANVTATPTAAGTYTYTVTAVDAGASCTTIIDQIIEVNAYPSITTVSAVPSTICAGEDVTLSATIIASSSDTSALGNITGSSSSTPTPFYHGWGGVKAQYIVRASEMTAKGFVAGDITSLAFDVLATGTTYNGFAISMDTTSQSAFTGATALPATQRYSSASETPVVGLNTYNFTTPFTWNGTSNIVVSVCWSNNNSGGTSRAVKTTSPGFTSSMYIIADNAPSADVCAAITTTTPVTLGTLRSSGTSSTRPRMVFTGQIGSSQTANYAWEWNPGSLSGSSVVVSPSTTTTYTVTASAGVCTDDSTVTVTVNPLPTTPVATNSTQCGIGTPTCSVAGGAGTFNWYLVPAGGTYLPGQSGTSLTSYPISETDTFYVSEHDGLCESMRVMVIATVDPVDTLTATISSDTICIGASATLTAVQTGGVANTFTITWTSSPDSLSGIVGSAGGGSVVVTPLQSGTYVYTVNGVDGACNAQPSSVTLVVLDNPTIDIGPDLTICSGESVMLTASNVSIDATLSNSITVNLSNPTTDEDGGVSGTSGYICPGLNNVGSFTLPPIPGTVIGARLTITGVGLNSGSYGSEVRLNFSGTGINGTSPCFQGATSATTPNPFNWATFSADTASLAALLNTAGGSVDIYYSEAYNDNTTGPDATFPATATLQYYYTLPVDIDWTSDPAGITGTGTTLNTGALTASTTIYATATSSAGCSTTDTLDITVVTSPGMATITASSDTICNSGSVTLTASDLAIGSSIQWQSSPSGLDDTWTNVGTDSLQYNTGSITSDTYYRLYATCSGTDTSDAILIVFAAPTVSATDNSRCGVGPITLTATSNGTVNWYAGSSGGSPVFSGNPYTPVLTATTTYWLEAAIGTCINTGGRVPLTATLNTAPSVGFTVSASSVCDGESVTLTASSSNDPNYTYYWSTDGINTIFIGNPYTFTPDSTASYYVIGIDSTGGTYDLCGAIDGPQTITWNEQPDVPVVTPSMSTVCVAGDSVQLTVTNPPTPSPGLGQIGTATTTTTAEPNPYYTTYHGNKNQYLILASELSSAGFVAGNMTNLGFDLRGVTTSLDLTNFTLSMGNTSLSALTAAFETGLTQVYTTPSYSVIANANTITNHTFSTPFYWDGSSNIIIETCFNNSDWNGSQTIAYTTTGFTSATYYRADAPDVCTSPGTPTTSSNRPNLYINGMQASQVVYTWNPGGATGQSVYVTPTASTVYTVTATIGPCSATGTAQVDYTPVNLVITPSGSTSFCGSGTVDLDAGAGYASYSWSDGTSTIGTTQMITVSPTATTSYTVTVDSGACTVSETIDVTVYPSTPINISPSSTVPICGGAGSITLTADAGYTNYMWSPGGETTDAIVVSPVATTEYTVTA
ncbi:MAG TPA: GEVED domain-containing protein, partial [Bacteroidia bacterium]|nr:GEVED domain-containing protein [Bacteroidia bacterium]